jgi:transcription elongation factor GreB
VSVAGSAEKPPVPITRAGAERLQAEVTRLRREERPRIVEEVSAAAAQGDRSENAEYIYGKKKLREIDRRLGFLLDRLERAQVVDPAEPVGGKVAFGHWVTVEDEDGRRASYRLVGEDELDLENREISWKSPLGRAVIGKKIGDVVTVQKPAGPSDVAIVAACAARPEPHAP